MEYGLWSTDEKASHKSYFLSSTNISFINNCFLIKIVHSFKVNVLEATR